MLHSELEVTESESRYETKTNEIIDMFLQCVDCISISDDSYILDPYEQRFPDKTGQGKWLNPVARLTSLKF